MIIKTWYYSGIPKIASFRLVVLRFRSAGKGEPVHPHHNGGW
jgi:hypothetical protein